MDDELQRQINELKKIVAWLIVFCVTILVSIGGVLLNQLINCIEKSL